MAPPSSPSGMHEIHGMTIVDQLVSDLERRRIRSVAFVVPSDVEMTMPLYEVAIATARRGWQIGLEDVRYWFVTPEHEPVSVAAGERLEPEGVVFIGSTYCDVRGRVVLLDPQGESIEADLVVSLGHNGGFAATPKLSPVELVRVGSRHELLADSRSSEPVRPAAVAA
jgi:hypothetical protein